MMHKALNKLATASGESRNCDIPCLWHTEESFDEVWDHPFHVMNCLWYGDNPEHGRVVLYSTYLKLLKAYQVLEEERVV